MEMDNNTYEIIRQKMIYSYYLYYQDKEWKKINFKTDGDYLYSALYIPSLDLEERKSELQKEEDYVKEQLRLEGVSLDAPFDLEENSTWKIRYLYCLLLKAFTAFEEQKEEEALSFLERMLSLDSSDHFDVVNILVLYYLGIGQDEKAKAIKEKYPSLYPNSLLETFLSFLGNLQDKEKAISIAKDLYSNNYFFYYRLRGSISFPLPCYEELASCLQVPNDVVLSDSLYTLIDQFFAAEKKEEIKQVLSLDQELALEKTIADPLKEILYIFTLLGKKGINQNEAYQLFLNKESAKRKQGISYTPCFFDGSACDFSLFKTFFMEAQTLSFISPFQEKNNKVVYYLSMSGDGIIRSLLKNQNKQQ